jgi:DNA-binding MarR family transcriptional regulator
VASERQDLLAVIMPVARALRRIEEDAASRHGLTMWQYAILAAATDHPGLNQREIASRLDYSANRLVHDLDRLVDLGFVERVPGADRRANLLRVTRTGRAARRRIQAAIHRAEDDLLRDVPSAARRGLEDGAAAVTRRLRGEGDH